MSRSEVKSEVTGTVWKVLKAEGEAVEEGEQIMILESMKMEIPLLAEEGGTIAQLLVKEGDTIDEGQVAALVETA